VLAELKTLIAKAADQLPPTLQTLQTAFEDGLFNDSFTRLLTIEAPPWPPGWTIKTPSPPTFHG